MKEVRQAWFEDQLDLDPERLVFVDETGVTTKMARLRGRAPRDQRCRMAVPHGSWVSTTLVLGLRSDGLVAPLIRRGAMTGADGDTGPRRSMCGMAVRHATSTPVYLN